MSERRVALVTGAFGGIGAEVVADLLGAGYAVAAVDLHVKETTDEHVLPLEIDIAAAGAAADLVTRTLERFGRLDLLVNCAGVLRDARIEKMDDDAFDLVFGINLVAAYRLVAAALPALRRSPAGRIISFSSRAWLGMFGSTNYSASKGGLVGMTRALALAEGGSGITVNAVAPGYIESPMTTHLNPVIPVGRPGHPIDVARVITFLAEPDAGYITGQTILICGGRSLEP